MARLYSDEDFSLPVVEELRNLGHDVLTAQEAGRSNQGISDSRVLAFAISSDVFSVAQASPPTGDAVVINSLGKGPALSAYLTDSAPGAPAGDVQRKKQWRERLGHTSDLIKTIVQA